METILVGNPVLKSIHELLEWVNGLVGEYAPGTEYLIHKVVQFQVIDHEGQHYSCFVLVEVLEAIG